MHGGYSFPLSDNSTTNYLHFSGLFSRQANATDAMLGGAWSVNVNNNDVAPINFYAGAWLRFSNLTDAIIPYVGLDYGSFNLGMTYDINVSAFKTASQGRGGIEISLIYIKKPSQEDRSRQVQCPRF